MICLLVELPVLMILVPSDFFSFFLVYWPVHLYVICSVKVVIYIKKSIATFRFSC